MSATITADNGGGTTVPHFIIVPYETGWESRSVVHDLIGGGIAVSVVAPRLRAGDMDLLYLTEADAFACAALHGIRTSFTLVESDRPHLNMTYVVDGSGIRVRLEDNANTWIVTLSYQETGAG